ncbi:MAG: restriction endonuclease subunit S, partial [Planctomycetaceae bacterium]|nr:restriction endonuclease subunit S [Planctomycetaceae bacterium]
TTELHVIRPLGGIDPHYVYRFLQQESVRRDAAANFTGSAGQLRAPMSFIADLELPLPPLAEQRRIVGKLELLLGKVSSSQQRLSRVPGLLKRFRQSVLAAACSGKLTADWREENDCVEPASDLIARLGSERRERHRELCVAAKNDKRGKPQEFDNIEPSVRTDLDTFDLPSDWSWVDLRFVMTVDEPFCYGVVQPGVNEPNGNLLVRAGDLQNGTVNLSELRRIPADIDAEYERSRLKGGELLVTVVGAGIGTVAIAPTSCAGFNIARAVAKVPIRDVSAEYVFQWFNTSKALSWMVGDAREVARPTLNLEQLRTILVPLPPLSEQQEIARRVEKLFAFADQIEARLRQAQAHIDRLTQSLLAKAFRGELVPTEHALAEREHRDYEPASALLERIRKESKIGSLPVTRRPRRRS